MNLRALPRSLLVASAVMLVLRVIWVYRFREIDSDAYGHYFIAIAARRDPGNINVHWVWLPFFHFLVGIFTKVGLTFRGVRLANAILATLPPLLIWDSLRNREAAFYAGLAFAVSPLLTILGQSAQPETLFLVFIAASIHAASREWPVRAGVWLALACSVRYEAWGAAAAIGVWWLWKDRSRRWFAYAAIPATVVALYILFRWWTDGTLLLFLRGTRDITKVQTAPTWTLRALVEFPIILPWRIIGPALLAIPFGMKTLTTRERFLGAGFAAFLLLSYYSGGSHAGERYLVSLTPFAWMAIGGSTLGRSGPRWARREVMVALVALFTIWHLHRAAGMATDWDEGLREREQKLEDDRVRP